jgi:hypothetical protein
MKENERQMKPRDYTRLTQMDKLIYEDVTQKDISTVEEVKKENLVEICGNLWFLFSQYRALYQEAR